MAEPEETFEVRWARVLAFAVPCICHKLNNSVVVVTGTSEMLVRNVDHERLSDQLALVLEHATDAGRQLRRLTTISRLDPVHRDSVDAAGAVEDVAALLAPVFNVTATRLEFRELAGALPCRTDRQRLAQVLLVLAVSALLPTGGYEFDTLGTLARLRLSAHYNLSSPAREGGVVIRISYPRSDAERALRTGALIEPVVKELGGSLETRLRAGAVGHRLVLEALD